MHLIILPMNGDCAPRASKADLPSKKKDNPRDRSPIDKSHVPESEMWGLTKTIIRQLCKSQIFHFFRRKQEKPKSKPSLHHCKGVTTTVWICTTTPSGQCANSSYTFGLPVVRLRSQPGLSPRGRRNDNHWVSVLSVLFIGLTKPSDITPSAICYNLPLCLVIKKQVTLLGY